MQRHGQSRDNPLAEIRAIPLYLCGLLVVLCGIIMVDRTALEIFPYVWMAPATVTAGFVVSLYSRYHNFPVRRLYFFLILAVMLFLAYAYIFNPDLLPLERIIFDDVEAGEVRLYLLLCYFYLWAATIRSFLLLRDKDVLLLIVPTLAVEVMLTATGSTPFNNTLLVLSVAGFVGAIRAEACLDLSHIGIRHRRYGRAGQKKGDFRLPLSLISALLICMLLALALWNTRSYYDRLFFRMSWRVIHWFMPVPQISGIDRWMSDPFNIGPVPGAGQDAVIARTSVDIPLYWRETAFDKYDGQSWIALEQETEHINGSGITRLVEGKGLMGRTVEARVEIIKPHSRFLLAPYQAVKIDYNGLIAHSQAYSSIASLAGYVPARTTYRIISVLPPEIPERAKVMPDVVRAVADAYLELPPLSARVRQLAVRITEGKETPLAKARAIESHLLSAYEYSLAVGAPQGEAVDYFLFNIKRGHCQYFATAMTVLARLNGIPARFASGYLAGEINDRDETVIRERDAHAWAELFMPGYGWVIFEATPGRSAPMPSTGKLLFDRFKGILTNPKLWLPLAGIIVGALLLAIFFHLTRAWLTGMALRRSRKRRLLEDSITEGTPEERIAIVYRQATDFLAAAGEGKHPSETPDEYLHRLLRHGPMPLLQELTRLYVEARYSSRIPSPEDADRALQIRAALVDEAGLRSGSFGAARIQP